MTVLAFIRTLTNENAIINIIKDNELVETIEPNDLYITYENSIVQEWSIIHKSYSDMVIIEVLI